jgi:hypothetical protein
VCDSSLSEQGVVYFEINHSMGRFFIFAESDAVDGVSLQYITGFNSQMEYLGEGKG